MRSTSKIGTWDFVLPVVAIRLAAATLTAWIFVASHMGQGPRAEIHAPAADIRAPAPGVEVGGLIGEQLSDMLSHD